MKKEKKPILREKSLTATVLLIAFITISFLIAYFRISQLTERRSLLRMEEGANTVISEVSEKFIRDSQILNTAAEFLEKQDDTTPQSMLETIASFETMMSTMNIRLMFPDNKVTEPGGKTVDVTGIMDFDEIAARGEHVSNRMLSIMDNNTLVIHHYVPIIKNGEAIAILYGVTVCSELPDKMNINNLYNANATVFIVDTDTGDLIMDSSQPSDPRNLYKISSSNIKTKENTTWDAKQIMSGKKGFVVYKLEGSDEWRYMYYAPSEFSQWVITVSVPEKVAFASLFAIRRIFWVIAIAIAIVVTLYYLWVRRNARKVLDEAVEKAVLQEKLQKAEAADRAKTMFLSNMSHDIRTPMNAIIGFTTLAQANLDKKERVQEYLAKTLSSSNHLLSLINDILDMSRIESGRLNIEEKECSISDIFRDTRNIILTQMQAKQLNFFMDTIDVIDEDIYCDKLHLNQVLFNLLSNAIKFTPAGGSVSLTIKQKHGAPTGYGAYEIRVKDTGIGMSPEFAEHVFEPFEREKTSTVSGIQGTGLGMAITKSIVDTMGGTITVETEQGKGTEFVINFEFRLQAETKQIEVIHELDGLRALVVDDNFNTCDSITKMLMQIGMRSEWTLYGKEAVLRAKQAIEMGDAFYAYIIDWLLPDLNGLEVTRQIRAEVGDDIPIIILTAYDWSNIEDEAKEAGVTAFCSKPIFLSELRDTLVNVINKADIIPEEQSIIPDMSSTLEGKRFLLVEDNEMNREIAVEILTESGFTVETAEDGSIGVEMVKQSEPGYYDLILMDVQMPIMNGYEATKAIRKLDNPDLANIPIVAMTANAFDEDQKTAFESGMNAHVAKPIDIEKMLDTIYTLLKDK